MQKKINIFLFILIPLLIIYFLVVNIFSKNELIEYTDSFNYLNTNIYLKIYAKDDKTSKKTFEDIEKIYSDYDALVSKYKYYDDIVNLYYLNYSLNNNEYIKLDSKLYDLIKYGKSLYKLSNGLIDISKGNIIDVWSSYQASAYGVPSLEELNKINTFNINDIVLKNNKILNNDVNIDLTSISKAYVTNKVITYLKKHKINKYVINAGENIAVGDNFDDGKYSIGIGNPDNKDDIIKVIKTNNKSIVTVGTYKDYYYFNNVKYNFKISPKTLYPTNYMKSVTVVSDDINKSSYIANTLFLMDITEGQEYVKNIKNVEVLWYTLDSKIITTDNFKKYD